MKKIYSIFMALIISMSMMVIPTGSTAATVNDTQEIKIDGTIGHRPCWGAWSKWKGSGYAPHVYYIKVDKKPKTMEVTTKNNVLPKVPIGKFINKPQEGVSVSYYNGNIQIFLGVKGLDAKAYLKSKPITVLLKTDKKTEPEIPKEPEDGGQLIKIDGTKGFVANWSVWNKWKNSGYTSFMHCVKVDKKPASMKVIDAANKVKTVTIGEMINNPKECISVSYYNGNVQIFVGVKGNNPKNTLKKNPITILLNIDENKEPEEPKEPEQPKEPTKPETPKPEDPDNQAIKDWDCFNNTWGNYVAYSPSQVAVNGKKIKMTAINKTVTVRPNGLPAKTQNYVSGAMVSKKAYKYGTFTFKFRLSSNNTLLWPMIWTLPDDNGMARPEFDLLESWGSLTGNSIIQTYHAYDSNGKSLPNYKQAKTPTDLTKEHTLKMVWTQDNVVKMYVDGVLKLTIKDYMVNYKTKQVDYQTWFINLGLGGYNGAAPNGTGWFEITDYSFEPVYTRNRVRTNYGYGNFTDGTLPSGKY